MKKLVFLVLFVILSLLVPQAFAQDNSFVSIVNPIRGNDFWDNRDQAPETAVKGQLDILKKYSYPATWLIRYDALINSNILDLMNSVLNDEKGLFMEITPSWTKDANVNYRQSYSWHSAASAFLTGYERQEREKLIDTAFEKFKKVYSFYPKSVGAWWIDAYSIEYMQKNYGIQGVLIVADQYTTDNYQIWGQYWSTPYYPSNKNALNPAQSIEDKLPVVMMQWASRDPINGYGNGVLESTYSVQANDYSDYHNLDSSYFSKLVDIYTIQPLNRLSHLVVGLENSYSWNKYKNEYTNQIKTLAEKNNNGQFKIVTMEKFAVWYQDNFPSFSPPQIIVANDPLGSSKKSVWFMNPYYRVGWFYNKDGSVMRDIRQYIAGEEEICYIKSCDQLNFATFATRVLDDVTYQTKWIIDEGKINSINVYKNQDKFIINYVNEVSKKRQITFLPRDVEVNGKISTIDGAILDATYVNKGLNNLTTDPVGIGKINFSVIGKLANLLWFLIFIFLLIFVPGLLIVEKINKEAEDFQNIFLSIVIGLALFTLVFYILSILNLRILFYIYPIAGILLTILKRDLVKAVICKNNYKFDSKIFPVIIIILGTLFQIIPVIKSGLKYDFGIGFWGPNTHDGVWHLALINQLIKSVPPQNPVFAGEILKNYHYFYDLLIAATNYISRIDVLDLVFRFYPVLFSLLLGLGSYYLCSWIFQGKKIDKYWACAVSLFLVYFCGSFGWVVEYISQKRFGGESAFWANQSISFNLNPPFAISLIIIIAIVLLITTKKLSKLSMITISLLAGTLIGFKAYAALIVIGSLLITGIVSFLVEKQKKYLIVFVCALLLSGSYLLMNGSYGSFFQFSPFWFIHSMIDAPDRVGWNRLSLARYVSIEKKDWIKFIGAETIGLAIFIIGNLNLRILGLIKIFSPNTVTNKTAYLFISLMSLIALLFPLFFIQSGTPWNTIQFFYYFMYFCAIFSGPVFILILRSRYNLLAIPVFLLIFISPINSVATARGYLALLPHAKITNAELKGLEYLSKQPDGIVLTYPYNKNIKSQINEPWPISIYDTTAYVAAFSGKGVYIEDESQNNILQTDYNKRLISEKDFFTSPNNNFLLKNKIKYIYIPAINKVSIDESKIQTKKIFDNNEVSIYRVN